jgi:hypothetical protein
MESSFSALLALVFDGGATKIDTIFDDFEKRLRESLG